MNSEKRFLVTSGILFFGIGCLVLVAVALDAVYRLALGVHRFFNVFPTVFDWAVPICLIVAFLMIWQATVRWDWFKDSDWLEKLLSKLDRMLDHMEDENGVRTSRPEETASRN